MLYRLRCLLWLLHGLQLVSLLLCNLCSPGLLVAGSIPELIPVTIFTFNLLRPALELCRACPSDEASLTASPFARVSLFVSLFVTFSLFLCLSRFVCLFVCHALFVSLFVTFSLFVCLSRFVCLFVPFCLFVCLSRFVCLFVCHVLFVS